MRSYDVDKYGRRTPAKDQKGAPSEDEVSPRRTWAKPHETGLVEAHQIADGAIWIVWILGAGLWAATLFGTYVPYAGGWPAFIKAPWPPIPAAAWLALGTQIALSWAQWTFKARAMLWWRQRKDFGFVAVQASLGWWASYALVLLISAGFSAYTYSQWAAPVLKGIEAPWAGLLIVGIGAIVVDMLPEWIFIRD
jgi:hypothetical protein